MFITRMWCLGGLQPSVTMKTALAHTLRMAEHSYGETLIPDVFTEPLSLLENNDLLDS